MKTRRLGLLAVLSTVTLVLGLPAHAQRAGDTSSVDSAIAALYDSISGPAGERDWDRFRALFVDDARLISVRVNSEGEISRVSRTVEGYIEGAGAYFSQNDFYERELARTQDSFGNIAHCFSTYGTWADLDDEPRARGINSIQLIFDGAEWRIVTVLWDSERVGQSIPGEYLPG